MQKIENLISNSDMKTTIDKTWGAICNEFDLANRTIPEKYMERRELSFDDNVKILGYACLATAGLDGDVVEIGVWKGKSLALMQRLVTRPGKAIGIDPCELEGQRSELAYFQNSVFPGSVIVTAYSEYAIEKVAQITKCIKVLHIDGAHASHNVWADFLIYEKLIVPGGYVIFDDYIYNDECRDVHLAVDLMRELGIFEGYDIVGPLPGYENSYVLRKIGDRTGVSSVTGAGSGPGSMGLAQTQDLAEFPRSEPVTALNFVEDAYLTANQDVADAVRAGHCASGRAHFDLIGYTESRLQRHRHHYTLPYTRVHTDHLPDFDDLSETFAEDRVPPMDRQYLDESGLTRDQMHWRRLGYLILPGLIPPALTEAFRASRAYPGGKPGSVSRDRPLIAAPEAIGICHAPALAAKLQEIFGADVLRPDSPSVLGGGFGWRQDHDRASAHGWSCAAWIAVDDVYPDADVLEFVPGFHLGPSLSLSKITQFLTPEAAAWTGRSDEPFHWRDVAEGFTSPALAAEIVRRGLSGQCFLPRRGDVVLWHSKLAYRGLHARMAGLPTASLVCHFNVAADAVT